MSHHQHTWIFLSPRIYNISAFPIHDHVQKTLIVNRLGQMDINSMTGTIANDWVARGIARRRKIKYDGANIDHIHNQVCQYMCSNSIHFLGPIKVDGGAKPLFITLHDKGQKQDATEPDFLIYIYD